MRLSLLCLIILGATRIRGFPPGINEDEGYRIDGTGDVREDDHLFDLLSSPAVLPLVTFVLGVASQPVLTQFIRGLRTPPTTPVSPPPPLQDDAHSRKAQHYPDPERPPSPDPHQRLDECAALDDPDLHRIDLSKNGEIPRDAMLAKDLWDEFDGKERDWRLIDDLTTLQRSEVEAFKKGLNEGRAAGTARERKPSRLASRPVLAM